MLMFKIFAINQSVATKHAKFVLCVCNVLQQFAVALNSHMLLLLGPFIYYNVVLKIVQHLQQHTILAL